MKYKSDMKAFISSWFQSTNDAIENAITRKNLTCFSKVCESILSDEDRLIEGVEEEEDEGTE